MSKQDIRWKQRFSNYTKTLAQLNNFMKNSSFNALEEQGLIHLFKNTYAFA